MPKFILFAIFLSVVSLSYAYTDKDKKQGKVTHIGEVSSGGSSIKNVTVSDGSSVSLSTGGFFNPVNISIGQRSQQPWYSFFVPRPSHDTAQEKKIQAIYAMKYRNFKTIADLKAYGSKFDRIDTKGRAVNLYGSNVRELIVRNKDANLNLEGAQVGTLYTPTDFSGSVKQHGGQIGERKTLNNPDEIISPAVGFLGTLKRLYWRYF